MDLNNRPMTLASEHLLQAIAKRLAQLLGDTEVSWLSTANWLDRMAWARGLDVGTRFDSATEWATNAVTALRPFIDSTRFPNGESSVANHEFADDLFRKLLPDEPLN
jgi:hypothetical protein